MVGSVATDVTVIMKMHPLVAHINCSQCKQSMVTKQHPDEKQNNKLQAMPQLYYWQPRQPQLKEQPVQSTARC